MSSFQTVHAGFDGLDVSFHGHFSAISVLDTLARAKEEAQKGEGDSEASTMLAGVPVLVGRTGAKGGFAFRFKIEDVNFFVKDTAAKGWALRVSVGSDMFLKYGGWSGVKRWLFYTLDCLGYMWDEESIGRVDYAVDILAPSFVLDPLKFKGHHKTTTSAHREEAQEFYCSGRCVGVTLGKMPNWQVCIYDKTKEIKQSQKQHWFQVWDIEDTGETVWRFEMRAGKQALKKRLEVRTFADVETVLPGAFAERFEKVAMLARRRKQNENVTYMKIHKIWQIAKEKTASMMFKGEDIKPMMTELKTFARQQKIDQAEKGIMGYVATYARLSGYKASQVNEFLPKFLEKFENRWHENNKRIVEKIKQAERRYCQVLELEKVQSGLC